MNKNQHITVHLRIRRFDLHGELFNIIVCMSGMLFSVFAENPKMEIMQVELNPNMDYGDLKKEVLSIFGLSENDDKVLKLRNKNHVLVPLTNLLEGNTFEK